MATAPRTNRPKAYSYLRFSTPEQSKGDSFRRQAALSEKYADEHGLDLDQTLTFQDLGVSAFRGRNVAEGQLGAFIKAVDLGRVSPGSYLLVESLDRLSRQQTLDAFEQFNAILKLDINIATLMDGKLYTRESLGSNFADLMFSLMIMSRAHEESLTKSRRLKSAWEGKREKARNEGRALTAKCPAWLRVVDGQYEAIEERVAVIRRVFQMTLDGYGKGYIARRFNDEGVPTFGRSKGWQSSYLQKILEGTSVLGDFQPMRTEIGEDDRKHRVADGEPLAGYFPAIIDREVYLKVRDLRRGRRSTMGPTGKTFSNLFTGIATCGSCGSPMHYVNKGAGPKGGVYLVCSAARARRLGCKHYGWRYWHVEAFTLLALSEVNWRELFPTLYEASQKALNDLQERRLVAEADLERAETQMANVVEAISSMGGSTALTQKLTTLEHDKDRLTALFTEINNEIATEQGRLADVARDYEEATDAFARYNEAQKSADEDEVYAIRMRLHRLLQRTIVGMRMIRADETPALDHQPEEFRPEWLHGVIELSFNGAAEHRRRVMIADDYKKAASFTPSGESETIKWMQADGDRVWMVEGTPVVFE